MEREKFLWKLAGGHAEVLLFSRMMRKAALAAKDNGTGRVLEELSRDASHFYLNTLAPHFEMEERMMRVFARHVGERDPDILRLKKDHAFLRTLAQEGSLEALRKLGDELETHMRFEDEVLFPRMEKNLDAEEKEALALALTRAEDGLKNSPGRNP